MKAFLFFFLYYSNGRLATFKKYTKVWNVHGKLEQILPFAMEEMLTSKNLQQFSEMFKIASQWCNYQKVTYKESKCKEKSSF